MSDTLPKSIRPFSFIKICNIKSIRCTNSRKWPMQFSQGTSPSLVLSFKMLLGSIFKAFFRQNPTKVKKCLFMACFSDYWIIILVIIMVELLYILIVIPPIFGGNWALLLRSHYWYVTSCKKSFKSSRAVFKKNALIKN